MADIIDDREKKIAELKMEIDDLQSNNNYSTSAEQKYKIEIDEKLTPETQS
jgi:hypothetical protein